MGGDHGHHGHGIKIPDYRIYKVENCPQLLKVRDVLARQGLKDPWLRNHVWRFNPELSGGSSQWGMIRLMVFRGFKYGFPLFLATIVIETGLGGRNDGKCKPPPGGEHVSLKDEELHPEVEPVAFGDESFVSKIPLVKDLIQYIPSAVLFIENYLEKIITSEDPSVGKDTVSDTIRDESKDEKEVKLVKSEGIYLLETVKSAFGFVNKTEEEELQDEGPVLVDKEPVLVDKGPVLVDKGPVLVDKEPVLVDKGPVLVDKPVVEDNPKLPLMTEQREIPAPPLAEQTTEQSQEPGEGLPQAHPEYDSTDDEMYDHYFTPGKKHLDDGDDQI